MRIISANEGKTKKGGGQEGVEGDVVGGWDDGRVWVVETGGVTGVVGAASTGGDTAGTTGSELPSSARRSETLRLFSTRSKDRESNDITFYRATTDTGSRKIPKGRSTMERQGRFICNQQ